MLLWCKGIWGWCWCLMVMLNECLLAGKLQLENHWNGWISTWISTCFRWSLILFTCLSSSHYHQYYYPVVTSFTFTLSLSFFRNRKILEKDTRPKELEVDNLNHWMNDDLLTALMMFMMKDDWNWKKKGERAWFGSWSGDADDDYDVFCGPQIKTESEFQHVNERSHRSHVVKVIFHTLVVFKLFRWIKKTNLSKTTQFIPNSFKVWCLLVW